MTARLARLEAEPFHSLIRIAAQTSTLFLELEQAILKRLKQGHLRVNDLFTLLFRYPTSGEAWQRLKHAVLQSLGTRPEQARTLLQMGAQASLWSDPEYYESEEGSEQVRRFLASVRVARGDTFMTSASHTALKKTLARHLASRDLLARLAGFEGELGEPQRDLMEEQRSSGSSSSVNAIGNLYELKSSLLIQDVRFANPQAQDPQNRQIFICNCTVVTRDGRMLIGSGTGTTKQAAKQAAAMAALRTWVLDDMEQRKTESLE